MYSRRTLSDGIKGSATGEASQSTDPWGLYGGEANRDAKKRKAHRTSGVAPARQQGKTKSAFTPRALLFFRKAR